MEPDNEMLLEKASDASVDKELSEAYELFQRQGARGFLISRCSSVLTMMVLFLSILTLVHFIDWSVVSSLTVTSAQSLSTVFSFKFNALVILAMVVCFVGLGLRMAYSLVIYNSLKHAEKQFGNTNNWQHMEANLISHFKLKDADDLRLRLLRKEHYIHALFIDGPLGRFRSRSSQALSWVLYYVLINHLFEPGTGILVKEIASGKADVDALSARIKVQAWICVLCSPIMFIYYLIYGIFGYAEQIRKSPGLITGLVWTAEATRLYFNYEELPHQYSLRMSKAGALAEKYLASKAGGLWTPIIRLLLFATGCFGLVLILIGTVNANAWTGLLLGQSNLLFLVGVISLAIGLAQGLLPDDKKKVHSKEYEMLIKTEYPEIDLDQLESQYIPRWKYLLQEFYSMLVVPYFVANELPDLTADILAFISQNQRDKSRNYGSFCAMAVYKDYSTIL